MPASLIDARPNRDVVQQHADLSFDVHADVARQQRQGIARPEKRSRNTLAHQRLLAEIVRQPGATKRACTLHVGEIGRSIDPAERAWKRCGQFCRIEGEGVIDTAGREPLIAALKRRCIGCPIVQCGLQRRDDVRGRRHQRQLAIDDHQLSIARAVAKRCQFHFLSLSGHDLTTN